MAVVVFPVEDIFRKPQACPPCLPLAVPVYFCLRFPKFDEKTQANANPMISTLTFGNSLKAKRKKC